MRDKEPCIIKGRVKIIELKQRYPTVITLVNQTHAGVLAQAEIPCLCQGGSFPDPINAANNKTDVESGTA